MVVSEHDDFDRDITEEFQSFNSNMITMFTELNGTFLSLCEAGFTETQALKFLAFCSIFEGDF
jgi:hypothetical protein